MSLASFMSARDRLLAAEGEVRTGEEACVAICNAFAKVIEISASAVMTTDPETHLPAGGSVTGFDPGDCAPFWDNELLDPDFLKFNDLARSVDPVGSLAEATDGDLSRSPRFKKLYAAAGVSDELRVAFVGGSTCLGIGAFLRNDGATYSATEVNDVRNLLVPATNGLRAALGRRSAPFTEHGPVVLLLGPDGRVLSMSEGAAEVLADLRISVDDEVPGTIMVAAKRARSSRAGARLTTRLRDRKGRWARVHVSPMDGELDVVSVTIDAARPTDLVPILLDSYALTERETDLVLLVCRGVGTKEMAAELNISVHTVRDHLKSIFEKVRVNSRGELVAQLFSEHVLGSFHETVVEA